MQPIFMNQASATCSADDRGENQMKDATRENPAKTTHTDLKRKMEVRHLRMISLGGVDRYGTVPQLRLHHQPGGPIGHGHRLRYRRGDCVSGHAQPRRAFRRHAGNRLIPCVCDQIHRSWNRLHRRDPVLADLDGRIGVRIHRCRTYLRKCSPARRYGFGVPCSSW